MVTAYCSRRAAATLRACSLPAGCPCPPRRQLTSLGASSPCLSPSLCLLSLPQCRDRVAVNKDAKEVLGTTAHMPANCAEIDPGAVRSSAFLIKRFLTIHAHYLLRLIEVRLYPTTVERFVAAVAAVVVFVMAVVEMCHIP